MNLSSNWQRFFLTVLAALVVAGIGAFSTVIMSNNQLAVETNTTVNHLKNEFSTFQNIRYQADMEQLNDRMAQYEARIDRVMRP